MAQLPQGQRLTLPITATQGYYFSTSGAAIVRVTPSNGGAFVVTIGTDETDIGWFGFDASLELIAQSGVLTYNTTPSALTAVQLGDQRDSDAVDVALAVNDVSYTAQPPAALTLIPNRLKGLTAWKKGGACGCSYAASDIINTAAITNTYYVDVARADNSGNGLTWATAKKGIRSAIDAANASGLPSRIVVKAGTYSRNNGFTPSGTGITTAVPLYVYSVYGRVLTGNFDELTYTKTGGQNYVWQTARSLVNSAYNPQLDRSYKGVASIALCDAEAGTFFTDNTTLYVHAHTSGQVSAQNCLPSLNANGTIFIGNNDVLIQGFDFVGGMAGAVSFSGGTTNAYVLDDCKITRAIGGTFASRTAQNGVVVLGCGVFAAFNSEASLNSNDGFNIHEDGNSIKPFSLTVNCSGFDNGTLPTSVSNNGLTVHDGCHAVDIGGTWLGSVGTNAGHINDGTVVWHFGTTAGRSDGDVINGGTVTWGAFGAWAGACTLYLDGCTDTGSSIGVYASGGGAAYLRNHTGFGQKVGSIFNY